MPRTKIAFVAVAHLAFVLPAGATECAMERATYVAPRSGAVLQFLPLPAHASPMDNNIFTLTFPGASELLTGDVAWTNGRRTIPYMAVRHACNQDDIDMERRDGSGLCRLWDGSVYALAGGNADWIPAATDPAPEGLLLPDFGDALIQWPGYYSVTDRYAWDAFKLIGCAK
ncbi:MAG: hypothetical protein JWR51_4527 [Devosia sp.]|uniref:hypothetical protein n=1 Tax=Devosia sp. TaxID=1871048 RepID=UPI00263A060F|nr:hypothetical protein [Devosia sp.]MDB5531424.1 hypothetical protein [Devosia sp.]